MEYLDTLIGRLDVLLLIFARLMGLFTTAPVFSNRFVLIPVRVALAVTSGFVVYPLLRAEPVPAALPGLVALVVKELAVGMIVGFVASLIFTGLQIAGELLDIDMGFGIVSVLDPMSGQQLPIIGNLQYIVALLLFLSVDGHHGLLLAVMDSYTVIPVGGLALTGPLTEQMLRLGGDLFRIGLVLAAPVLAALFLTTVALALVGRAVPQMNIFVVGLQVKAAAGLALLAVFLPLYAATLTRLFDRMFAHLYGLMPLMK